MIRDATTGRFLPSHVDVSCSIEGCPELAQKRGWCGRHYGRWIRHGDPLGGREYRVSVSEGRERRDRPHLPHHKAQTGTCAPPTDRWIDRLIVEAGGCWGHERKPTAQGYRLMLVDGSYRVAHRVVYEWIVGPIPNGLTLDHLCRNRGCLNPSHLEPVTVRTNILRGESFVARNAERTHCKRGHPFDEENTCIDPLGKRICRTCRRLQRCK